MKLSGRDPSRDLLSNDLFLSIEGAPNPKIEDIFRHVPCAVCQHPSSGIHFGATTCEVTIQHNKFLD